MLNYKKTDQSASESEIMRAVIEWASYYPELRKKIIHVPNEGKRSLSYGRNLKAMGLVPGCADLFVRIPRHGYHGAFIEVKTLSGKISALQSEFLESAKNDGYFACCTRGLDNTLLTLKWYCFD